MKTVEQKIKVATFIERYFFPCYGEKREKKAVMEAMVADGREALERCTSKMEQGQSSHTIWKKNYRPCL